MSKTKETQLLASLQRIQRLIAENKLKDAARALNDAQKISPGDARLMVLGALMAEKSGNLKGAEQLLRRADAIVPNWFIVIIELARILARLNEFEESLQLARKAIDLDAQNPAIYLQAEEMARRANQFEQALQWSQKAAELAPGNPVILRRQSLSLSALKQYAQALEIYDRLIQSDPANASLVLDRLKVRLDAGDIEGARVDGAQLMVLQPENPEYIFWNDMAQDKTPGTQPPGMLQQLFDNMSEHFDEHLVRGLRYRAPLIAAEKLKKAYPDNNFSLLDLGCGTGLLGVCLGGTQKGMVGVELSSKMIEQAARHNLYARFHTVNLLDALHDSPSGEFDVIAALDVFIYVGDVSSAIPNAMRVLAPNGYLIFTCETAPEEGEDFALDKKTLRYVHKRSAMEALCRKAGFVEVEIEDMHLRFEGGQAVKGFMVLAHKPA